MIAGNNGPSVLVAFDRRGNPRRGRSFHLRAGEADQDLLVPTQVRRLGERGVLTQPSAFSGHGCCPRLLSAIGSTSLGSLFLTLPTRALTGQQVISPRGRVPARL
jgi:hypothetical protein